MNLALFDFDGTITSRDSFVDFVHFASSQQRILAGTALLSPWIFGYRSGFVSATRIREYASIVAFRGRLISELMLLGQRFADRVLVDRVTPWARGKLEWHRARGDRVVVVSASLHVYLSAWCGGSGVELICTELEVQNGRTSGRFAGGDCTGEEKRRRVLQRYDLSRFDHVYAYGDTPEDRELLSLAHKRYYRGVEQAT